MSELNKQKLREIKVTDEPDSMMGISNYAYGSSVSGSGSGTNIGSGSGSETNTGSGMEDQVSCPKDECQEHRDCWSASKGDAGSGTAFCMKKSCGFLNLRSYRYCDPASEAELACIGIGHKKECKVLNPLTGNYKWGYCSGGGVGRAPYCWFGGNIAVPD